MSTRLWEDTIILAIRDMQWIDALTNAKPWPANSLVKLDGPPEEALADLAMANGQLFYLIEVKSSPDQFRDEWHRKAPGVSTRRFNPKHPYKKLAKMLAGNDKRLSEEEVGNLTIASANCHFFAYCPSPKASTEITEECRVMVTGYVNGCVNDSRDIDEPERMQPIFDVPTFVRANPTTRSWDTVTEMPFSSLLTGDCRVGYQGTGQFVVRPPGVTRKMFQDYLFLLTDGDADDAEINALVLAPGTRFVRLVRSVRDLALVLGDYRPEWDPAPERVVNRRVSRQSPTPSGGK